MKIILPAASITDSPVTPAIIALRERYRRDLEFAKAADELHHARMLPGPACDSCLELASRMEK